MEKEKDLIKHKTLEERAEEYGGKLGPYKEMNFGEPVGREIISYYDKRRH